MPLMLEVNHSRISRNNSAWNVIALLTEQGYIAKPDSDEVAITLKEGDQVLVSSISPRGDRCVYVCITTENSLPKGYYYIYIHDGLVRTGMIKKDVLKSTVRANFTCTKSTNSKGTATMFESNFKVVEGEYKTTNEAYGILRRLAEVRRFRVLDGILASVYRVTAHQRFHVVVINRAMVAFVEVPTTSGIVMYELALDSEKNVVTKGIPLRSMDLAKRHVAVLEWVGEVMAETDDVNTAEVVKTSPTVIEDSGWSERSPMIYTDKLTIGKVIYRIGFANNGMEVRIGNVDGGAWLLGVINYLGRLNNLKDAAVIMVSRITYDDGSIGAMMKGLPGFHATAEHFYVLSDVDGQLRSCGRPLNYFVTGMEMHVMIEGVVEEEKPAEPYKKAQVEWIPHSGQFVVLKDDPKKVMYILGDYDQAERKFILTLADSARRERLDNLQVRGEPSVVMVDPSKIRPFVLTY